MAKPRWALADLGDAMTAEQKADLRTALGFLGMSDVEFVYAEGLALGADDAARALGTRTHVSSEFLGAWQGVDVQHWHGDFVLRLIKIDLTKNPTRIRCALLPLDALRKAIGAGAVR